MANELKPCPFCGSNDLDMFLGGELRICGKIERRGIIDCDECGLEFTQVTCSKDDGTHQEQLIRAWNTRRNPKQTRDAENGKLLIGEDE